jgi:hypothetical protein
LGGAVITYAVAGIEDEQLKRSIASIVTIGSPLHGIDPSDIEQAGLGPAVWWTSTCNGILLTSQASIDLRNDFADFTARREESDVARRLGDSLQWVHDQGGRIGTFGNSYDCVYNHANCGFLQFELDNHFWTQVYPAGGAPLGHSEMYDFVPAPPDCELGVSCIERSHDYLLKRPQSEMLDAIGNAEVEAEPGQELSQLPQEFLGQWIGEGTQTDPDLTWPITIDLTGGSTDEIVGTVDYPPSTCSGELTYLGGDAPDAQGLLFTEDITVGEENCLDGGEFTLTLLGTDQLQFYWSHPADATEAQGVLTRAPGIVPIDPGTDPSQTSYVQVLALTCPGGGPDVSFEIGPLPFTIDPVECTAPTVSLTITDAAGNATPIEATGFMNLDLPAGSYTITEQGSGATAAFELPVVDTRETQPPECIGRASCVSIVVSIPSTDAPIPSEPGALHEFFIGSWEGVGTQTNPAIDWPISVTFFPGNAGDVVGTVEYPTLGCGGDLVLTYVDPDDPFQTIEVSEDITYGEENCTDNGTLVISGTEGCCGMTFRWSSPDGGSTAAGWLDPALDDGGGAPGIEPSTLQIELTVMGTPPEGWTYAIELTAPDTGALVCQELTDPDGDGVYLSDNLAGPGFEDPNMTFFYGARLVEGYGYLGGDAPGAGMRTSCLAEEVATVGEYEPQAVTMDTIFTPIQVFEDFGGDASDAYGAAIPITFELPVTGMPPVNATFSPRLIPDHRPS